MKRSHIPWLPPLAILLLCLAPAGAAEESTGGQIYQKRCASCHGKTGEGTDDAPQPLAGDRSVAQLSRLIAKTMPKDAPVKCTGPDADKVAAYIYDAFYSKEAQARNKPPRLELSRLTVRQYRQSVADLVGTFRPPGKVDGPRGLRGEYYKGRRFRNGERLIDRTDPEVRFDFGTTGPDPKKFEDNDFMIRWSGSLLAPETGTYEFIVRTEHAARLWVNDLNRPLLDAWVKSGKDTEFRASIFLLEGRAYPLRLEFAKAKQGVDDSKTNKNKPPPVKATVALLWKLPHLEAEVIPERHLTPASVPEGFVPVTPFPPDDRSLGYERGTAVSKAWDQATTEAALETSAYVVRQLRDLSGVSDGSSDRGPRLRDFCRRFAERAFRRPLTDAQKRMYIDGPLDTAPTLELGVQRSVLMVLKSPRFLYHQPGGSGDGYDAAARLAFALWDSLPDAELLDAAARGQLATRDQVERHAARMVNDPRARAKLRAFMLQWLRVDEVPDLAKDPRRFPGFDATLAGDLRASLDLFLDDVLGGPASDFRQLFLADTLYLNGRLGKFYGADLPDDAPFRKVSLQPEERAGLLTHPYLTATFAYTGASSPIHRGVFLSRSVLGRTLRPPPEAVSPLAPDLHPQLTTRERVILQTKPQACLACHGLINPLGFTLEHFDAVGRFRAQENGKPIDSSGTYQARTGEVIRFAGIRDLAKFVARSEETREAFVDQLFHYCVKQPIRAYGQPARARLTRSFADNQYNVRRLLADVAAASALHEPPSQGEK